MSADLNIDAQMGSFTLTEIDPPGAHKARKFSALLTNPAVVTAGYGGWARVARPRRNALTEWVGRDALSLTMDFIIDNFDTGQGLEVEKDCQILDEMAGVEAGDPEPPLLRLEANPPGLIPHDYHRASQTRWFIESLTWTADQVRYNNAGNRLRAAGSLIMTQYVADDKLSRQTDRNTAKKGSHKKVYIVKKGDTLSKIAARKDVYGDATKWHKIAKANKIRDPKHLTVGQKLKIP